MTRCRVISPLIVSLQLRISAALASLTTLGGDVSWRFHLGIRYAIRIENDETSIYHLENSTWIHSIPTGTEFPTNTYCTTVVPGALQRCIYRAQRVEKGKVVIHTRNSWFALSALVYNPKRAPHQTFRRQGAVLECLGPVTCFTARCGSRRWHAAG